MKGNLLSMNKKYAEAIDAYIKSINMNQGLNSSKAFLTRIQTLITLAYCQR